MAADQPNAPVDQTEGFLKNSAIAGAVICPLAMLLPPRKMDLRFFVLMTGFSMSTSHLAKVYTGESLYGRVQRRAQSVLSSTHGLPAEAQRTQQLLREHRAAEEREREKQRKASGLAKVAEEVWMGGEGEDWQKKRIEEHQKSFAEGKGMSGIIMDQISDVWSGNWRPGSKKDEGVGEGSDGAASSSSEAKHSDKKK